MGSSVDLGRRLREYFNVNHLEANKSMPICCALLKYGYSNFSLTILEYCAPSEVIARENHYISSLNPDYNLCPAAGSWLGKKHSAVTREKLSAANFGKINSATTRARMSAAHKGKIHSEEHKAKISASMFGKNSGKNQPNSVKIEVLDLETNEKTIFPSMTAAAKSLNISSHKTISFYFKNNQQKPYKARYIFRMV